MQQIKDFTNVEFSQRKQFPLPLPLPKQENVKNIYYNKFNDQINLSKDAASVTSVRDLHSYQQMQANTERDHETSKISAANSVQGPSLAARSVVNVSHLSTRSNVGADIASFQKPPLKAQILTQNQESTVVHIERPTKSILKMADAPTAVAIPSEVPSQLSSRYEQRDWQNEQRIKNLQLELDKAKKELQQANQSASIDQDTTDDQYTNAFSKF